LLCVKRAGAAGVGIEDIVKELYIAQNAVSLQLSKFISEGFVLKDQQGYYKYSPNSLEFANTVDALETLYAKRRIAITDLIYRHSSQALESIAKTPEIQGEDMR